MLIAFLLIYVLSEVWHRTLHPPVEVTRKLVHISGGLITALFPWILTSFWSLLVLGVLNFGLLWGTRKLKLLQSVHGVERRSCGDLYYILGVLLLFAVTREMPSSTSSPSSSSPSLMLSLLCWGGCTNRSLTTSKPTVVVSKVLSSLCWRRSQRCGR